MTWYRDEMIGKLNDIIKAYEERHVRQQPVYDAAMAWMYCDPEFRDIAESNLRVACRQAKEGR